RLLNELRQRTDDLTESLEQQTATSEVLKIVSGSPGELEPIFRAMLENATRICEANFGFLQLYENEAFRIGATHNVPPGCAQAMARRAPSVRPSPFTPRARVVGQHQLVHIVDYTQEAADKQRYADGVSVVELAGVRSVVVLPMLKEAELIGAIHIYRQED